MHGVTLWFLPDLMQSGGRNMMSPDGDNWYPARPEGDTRLRARFWCAWLVVTGKADAVRWPAGQ